jgi:hypothetical protein
MKKFNRKQIAGFMMLVAASVLLITGLVFALYRKPIESAEVAAWVQAVGSVAAILAAIWISRDQERQRRKDARAAALIMASSARHHVALLLVDVEAAVKWFETASAEDLNLRGFPDHLKNLQSILPLTAEELIRLAPIAGDCALKLSAGFGKLQHGIAYLQAVLDDARLSSNLELRQGGAKQTARVLRLAMDDFNHGCASMASELASDGE